MQVTWVDGFDQGLLLKKIAAITKVNAGKASLSGYDANEYLAALQSMIRIDGSLPSQVKDGLVTQALFEAIVKPAFAATDVLEAVKRKVRAHQAKPDLSFVLVTTINVANSEKLQSLRARGCHVSFPNRLPNRFGEARASIISESSSWLGGEGGAFQTTVCIRVTAKSAHEAGNQALDAVDLIRGIWNLFTNLAWRRTFGGRKTPINQFMLGAVHTLHKIDGSLVQDMFWYEPHHFSGKGQATTSKAGLKKIATAFRKKLSRLPYRLDIETAILRYTRALDTDDHDASFVKLWSVLEFLTDTGLASYDKTVKRASYMMKDGAYHRLVLQHLRQHRNRSVHGGQSGETEETEIYQLKRYVEYLIRFHVGNGFGFNTLSGACEFMDLPADADVLKKRIALMRTGLKYLGA